MATSHDELDKECMDQIHAFDKQIVEGRCGAKRQSTVVLKKEIARLLTIYNQRRCARD